MTAPTRNFALEVLTDIRAGNMPSEAMAAQTVVRLALCEARIAELEAALDRITFAFDHKQRYLSGNDESIIAEANAALAKGR